MKLKAKAGRICLMYEKLLFPVRCQDRILKNKIVIAPNPSFLCDKEGNITPQFFTYYKNLIEKGAGMLIVEGSAISASARGWNNQCMITEESNFLAISELVIKMRSQDCLPMIQLYHAGINAISSQFNKVCGPSRILHKKITAIIEEVKTEDIEKIVEDYKKAATLAWNAGFAGVEINASDSGLLHQFMSPITNKRNDEYAFGFNNGVLPIKRVINGIKEVAKDLIISVKLSLRDLIPGGAGLNHSLEIAETLMQQGVDLFHITEGLKIGNTSCLHPYLVNNSSPTPFADDALVFKKETQSTVILSGGMYNPAIAEKALTRECCDLISLDRVINAEPDWIDMAITNQPIEFYKKCKNCMLCQAAVKGCILKKQLY